MKWDFLSLFKRQGAIVGLGEPQGPTGQSHQNRPTRLQMIPAPEEAKWGSNRVHGKS